MVGQSGSFYTQVRRGKAECIPLFPKNGSHPSLEIAAAMQYEETLTDLEHAMRNGSSTEEVRELVADLNLLSEQLKTQPGLAAHLERGGFGVARRDRLKKEYLSRYVLLRGGGPTYPNPPGDPMANGLLAADPSQAAPGGGGDDGFLSELTDKAVRHNFVMKVYGILCVQLLITTILGGITMSLLDGAPKVMVTVCFFLSAAATLGVMCICYCNPSLMRTYPTNYGILLIFTVAQSVLVGLVGAAYTAESVLILTCVTAFIVLGLSLFAWQTTYDITGWGPYLLCVVLVMFSFSIGMMFAVLFGLANTEAFQTMRLVYACVSAMLFCLFIVYDTQLIIGGKHEQMFAIDDYCMAALCLYTDIIQLFLNLLEIFGGRSHQ